MQVTMRLRGVRAGIVLACTLACAGASASAQERGGDSAPQGPKRRFFGEPVDFWQRGISLEKRGPEKAGPSSPATETEWGQVVRLPDGSSSYRELPKPLVQVLEDPNPENIRRYFEWRLARAGKILRAAEAIREFREGSQKKQLEGSARKDALPGGAAEKALAEPAAPAQGSAFTVLYFHREGCVHCQTQGAVLAQWLKKRPEVTLEKIEFGAKPELWSEYKVRGTPSIAIVPAGAKRGRFLEGLAREEVLELAVTELAKNSTGTAPSKEGSKHVAPEK